MGSGGGGGAVFLWKLGKRGRGEEGWGLGGGDRQRNRQVNAQALSKLPLANHPLVSLLCRGPHKSPHSLNASFCFSDKHCMSLRYTLKCLRTYLLMDGILSSPAALTACLIEDPLFPELCSHLLVLLCASATWVAIEQPCLKKIWGIDLGVAATEFRFPRIHRNSGRLRVRFEERSEDPTVLGDSLRSSPRTVGRAIGKTDGPLF